MDLIPAVVADAPLKDRRSRCLVHRDGDVPRWVEEGERGGIEQGGGLAGAVLAENTATLPTVLKVGTIR